MNRRLRTIFPLLLAWPFDVAAEPAIPSDEEQAKIAEPYQGCMRAVAQRLDDGVSDIAVLGKAVADACKPQFDEMINGLSKNLSPEERKTLLLSEESQQVGFGAVAVGEIRAAKHKKNSN